MAKKLDTILADALSEKGLVDKKLLERLLKDISLSGGQLQQVLLKQKLVSESNILQIFSDKLKIPFVSLKSMDVKKEVMDKVPVKIASYYKFIPVEAKDRVLSIAVASPLDIKTEDEIRTQLGYDINILLATQDDIAEALKKYYGFVTDTLEGMSSTLNRERVPSQETGQEAVEDIEKLAEDASVIKLVNQIILEGFKKRATDIHIEPQRNQLSLRYRIDGLLYDMNVPTEMKSYLNAIISRIKIMSNLNIVERRLPQDGRAVVKVQEQILDLRISTIPTPFGESVVIRILPTNMLFSLEKLGLSRRELQVFETLIQKPHGILFVTGPTGSGKTTTLYAALSRINTRDRKIITIEDPIEYEMAEITQIQVMPEIGLDFARGLRSILRHDPDVIMVGEVRDLETAEIAIRVALTGHLVFSTLHTNDAASGITRLLDIGVEPYLVASSVEAFIAQRLVRLICPDCKYEDQKAPLELKELIAEDLSIKKSEAKIFRGKGCPSCNFTGFFGRTAIYEILITDDAIKDMVLKKVALSQIKRAAVSKGMRTLRQDGWQRVIMGLTTPEEVMKVTVAESRSEKEKGADVSYPGDSAVGGHLPKGEEDRVYPRLDNKANLRYKVFKSKQELSKRGLVPEQLSVTKNISAGGILFYSDEPLSLGSILEIKIELPADEGPIECLGRVVRIEEAEKEGTYYIAVCFLDITSNQRGRLNRYIKEQGG